MAAQLSHKFVRSLPWAMGEAFFNTLYGVSVVVVIGRFIAPVELGAASTAIATVAVIEVVSSAGLQEAVVRARSADTDVIDTAFIMAMTFAVLGMVVCYLAALGVAAAFGDRRLIALVLVASLLLPFNAAANRANAKLGGRPPGSMSQIKRDLSERCRVKDMRHVEILEDIAENSTNEGYRLTAIRDLFDRGHGRPRQAIEGSGPGGAIPFSVILPAALCDDDD